MNKGVNTIHYKKSLKKVEQFRQAENENIHLDTLRLKIDIILQELRSQRDNRENKTLLWSLFSCLLLVMLISSFVMGFGSKLISFALLIGFMVYWRINLIQSAKRFKAHKLEITKAETEGNYFIRSKIKYVLDGLRIKLKQNRLICLFYIVFFPLFVFYLTQLIKSQLPYNTLIISIILAYIISGIPWYFVFRYDLIQLQLKEEELLDQLDMIE